MRSHGAIIKNHHAIVGWSNSNLIHPPLVHVRGVSKLDEQ